MSFPNQIKRVSLISCVVFASVAQTAVGGVTHYADSEFGIQVAWSDDANAWWDDCADFTNSLDVPDEADHVIICATQNVCVDEDAFADSVWIEAGGYLVIESGNTLTIDDDSLQLGQSNHVTYVHTSAQILIESGATLEFVDSAQEIEFDGTITVEGTLAFRDAAHTISGSGDINVEGDGKIVFEDADHTISDADGTLIISGDYNPSFAGVELVPLITIEAGTQVTLETLIYGEIKISGLTQMGEDNGAFHNDGRVSADEIYIDTNTLVTDTSDGGPSVSSRWVVNSDGYLAFNAEATGLLGSFYVHSFGGDLDINEDVTTEGGLSGESGVTVASGHCFIWDSGSKDEDSIPDPCP